MMECLGILTVMLAEFAILDAIFMYAYCKKNHLKFKAIFILRYVCFVVFSAFGMTFAAWLSSR